MINVPIPIATRLPKKVHYLHRSSIHKTVCGLSTDLMERYFGALDLFGKPICTLCQEKEHEAAKL